jgi:uncharacterized iron-regulated membrane protein
MNWFGMILDRPRTLPVHRWIVQVHLWVGLVAGLLISLLGISGSAIVFRQEIFRAANAQLMSVEPSGTPVPLQQQADQVLEANPGAQIEFIELPRDARDSTQFSLGFIGRNNARDARVYVNPYTGQILGSNPRNLRWQDWLSNFHTSLLVGRTGRLVDGIVASCFLAICLTGIVIWWPGRPSWKRNVRFNTRLVGWQFAFDFHKVVGFWTVVFLAMFAITGISFTWNLSNLVYWMTHSAPRKSARIATSWKSGDKILPLDEYLVKVESAVPGAQITFVDLPFDRGKFVRVTFRLPDDLRREGAANTAFLDPGTGAVLRLDVLREAPLGQRVLASLGAFHFGEFGIGPVGELPVKTVWVIMGLTPGALFFTGLLPWWNRVMKKRWAQREV